MLGAMLAAILIQGKSVMAQQSLTQNIEAIFRQYAQEEGVYSAFFRIESESLKIEEDYVQGVSDDAPVTLQTPFYTASIGKVFTAVAIAKLVEEGRLSFDDEVMSQLGEIVSGLHVIDSTDYGAELRIHHLLSHTSGLPDYFEDQPISGLNMIQRLFTEPGRFWEPEELIAFTKANFKSHFKPGEGYHYTDTEYILLGLIIERVSGMELHEFFVKHFFQPLSMSMTSMNLRSSPLNQPQADMAELHVGTIDISGFKSLSADWAGGAIISTGKELNRFLRSLLGGEQVGENTLNQMQQWIPESQGTYYGYGLRKWVLRELSSDLPEITLIGHSGSTGAFMYFCPELQVYVSGTFNQTGMMQKHIVFLAEVLSIVHDSKSKQQRK